MLRASKIMFDTYGIMTQPNRHQNISHYQTSPSHSCQDPKTWIIVIILGMRKLKLYEV